MIGLEALQLRIGTLSGLMEQKHPGYVGELEIIRSTLQRDPEMLHLLDPEKDLAVIYDAMAKFKQIEIPEAAKKAEKNKLLPKGKAITLDDF